MKLVSARAIITFFLLTDFSCGSATHYLNRQDTSNYQAIINFKGKNYFVYHNGARTPDAASFHRSVCNDFLYFNKNGTIKRVIMTSEGVQPSK